ncbi:MAG TPA: FAD-binding oxidoreductase [Gaiellaceae bacterium]
MRPIGIEVRLTAVVEAAVIGGGVMGLAIARELRDRGVRATVFERTAIGAGASGVQPGGVRQQWGTPIACRLARESAAFWVDAEARLASRVPLGLRRCGYLFAAHSEAALARLGANVAVQNVQGVPSRIVSPEQAAGLVPGLRSSSLAGAAWCAEDGYFDRPQSVVEAFASGLEVRIAAVDAVHPDGAGWRLELAGGGAARADAVVVAAGADTPALVRALGVDLPIEREDRYLFLSEPIRERLLEPLVVSAERRFAAKQLGDGRVLASDLGARGDPDGQRERWRATIRAGVEELLPALEFVSFPVLVRGEYDVTPDHQPLLGTVAAGLHVAAGFSGHGFMIAPAVARIVAGSVLGEDDEALHVLDVARFAENRAVPEPQLV